MFTCKLCPLKKAIVSCYYCPLTLYCSMTCAAIDQKKHPCHIAAAIFRDQFILPNAWNLFQDSLKDLEFLFQFEISKEKFEDLLNHNICFSFSAISMSNQACHVGMKSAGCKKFSLFIVFYWPKYSTIYLFQAKCSY